METPTYVVDTATLVNHIHEIKKWIYQGHIKVVIPIQTNEGVNQLEGKAVEQQLSYESAVSKVLSQRASVRKEYPTFDVNARITHEFLRRARSKADELPTSAITFQDPSKKITVNVSSEEPKNALDKSGDRPQSFAQALLGKPNMAGENGNDMNGTPKENNGLRPVSNGSPVRIASSQSSRNSSPTKPQAIIQNSIQRNGATAITNGDSKRSSKGDPRPSREVNSLLTYARESLRNGQGNLFTAIMTNDARMLKAAQDLSISAKSIDEVRLACVQSKGVKLGQTVDLNVEGELELLKDKIASLHRTDFVRPEKNGAHELGLDAGDCESSQIAPDEKSIDPSATPMGDQEPLSVLENRSLAFDMLNGMIVKSSEEHQAISVGSEISQSSAPKDNSLESVALEPAVPLVVQPTETVTSGPNQTSQSIVSSAPKVILSQAKPSQQSTSNENLQSKDGNDLEKQDAKDTEDSDEEVVVFAPRAKRFSQPKQVSPPKRPSQLTLIKPPKQQLPQLPQKANVPKSDTVRIERPRSATASKPATTSNLTTARTTNGGPAIIDPDAFGRSFAKKPSDEPSNRPRSMGVLPRSPRATPQRVAKPLESDVDFVLKSGAPRGASRGRGKLWVPS